MDDFVVGFKVNRQFKHMVAANFTIEGTGAAVMLGAVFLDCLPCLIGGLVLVAAGAFVLFMDLGAPDKFWRSITRPDRSWISRGSIFIACLILFGVLYVIFPSTRDSAVIKTIIGLSALLTMSYTGFLICSMNAIPFWRSKLVPILFVLHSLSSGLLLLLFYLSLAGVNAATGKTVMQVEIVLLVAALVITWLHVKVVASSSSAARESVRMLLNGQVRLMFLGGALFFGFVLPLAILIIGYKTAGAALAGIAPFIAAAMLSRLLGDISYRMALLRTGVYEPVLS
jgi:formate-dependent nitrite reductase membrane component NrfD